MVEMTTNLFFLRQRDYCELEAKTVLMFLKVVSLHAKPVKLVPRAKAAQLEKT